MKIRRLLISAGAMKAGTSWLFKQMEMHEQIETVPVKEIHYFAHIHTRLAFLNDPGRIHNYKVYARTCNEGRSTRQISRDAGFFRHYLDGPIDDRWYRNLFTSGPDVVKADFSNMACILDEQALLHMKRMARQLRVIYILRDPLARLWSHIKFHAHVIGDAGNLEAFSRDRFRNYIIDSGAALQSDYAVNIARLRQHFDESEMRIFYFEDFVARPQHALNDVFHFVGVSPRRFEDAALKIKHNVGPAGDCPAAFLEAAAEFLLPQQDALSAIGIEHHPGWDYMARLQDGPPPPRPEPAGEAAVAWWRRLPRRAKLR